MSDTTTPKLGLTQPAPGGSQDTWGGKLNHDLDLMDIAFGAVATGTVMNFAGSTIPIGWLLCDGRAVSRTIYAQLYAAIGAQYGTGDGFTTFNLPNCRANYVVGVGTGTDAGSVTKSYFLGQSGGYFKATIAQANLPNYSITLAATSHAHNYSMRALNGFALEAGYPGYTGQSAGGTTSTGGAHSHTVTLGGGGQGLDVTAPSIALSRIIFAGGSVVMAAASPAVRTLRTPLRGSH